MRFKRIIAAVLSAAVMVTSAVSSIGAETVKMVDAPKYEVPCLPDSIRLSDIVDTTSLTQDGYLAVGGAYTSTYLNRMYGSLTEAQKTEMDNAADKIIEGIDDSWSDLAKILYVHDIITYTRSYDTTYKKYTAYNNLVEKTSVCQGYAEAFWLIMYKLDIDCKIVASDKLNHAWNLVEVDGNWYHIDLTWDDPLNDVPGRSVHTYFLLSDNAISTVDSGQHAATDFNLQFESRASASNFATSTKYDSGWFWEKCRSPIPIINNRYFSVKDSRIVKSDDNNESVQLIDLSDRIWNVVGSSNGYWIGCFSGVTSISGTLYYSDATKIYSCDENGQDIQLVYELPESDTSKHYIYGIYNVDGNINISLCSTPYTFSETRVLKINAPIEKPKAVSAAAGDGCVTLTWNSANGATGYRVQYRLNGTTEWSVKDETTTSCTISGLTNGKKYDFVVLAYDGNDWSKWTDSDIVNATPTSLTTPANVKAVTGGGNVTITWDAVPGSTSYRVYRSDSLKGARNLEKVRTSTYYIDTNVEAGKTYYYWIMAYNADSGDKSAYSSSASVEVANDFAKTVSIKSASVLSTSVTLKWDIVPGATSYRIYRRNDDGSRKLLAAQSMTEYKDAGLTKGKVYKYEIRAYSKTTGALSNYSPIKQARPMAAPTITSGNVKGKITWDKNLVATSYRVYRADSLTGAKKLLAPTKLLTYTDTTAEKGKTYYYFVAAYDNSTGTLSAYSQAKVINIS